MKQLFGVFALCVMMLTAMDAQAQSIGDKRQELQHLTMDGAKVRVYESNSVHEAVASVEGKVRRKEVEGYRVVIFSDNGQYAGDNARKVLESFQQSYPHINAYMVYESPYFKVSVGDCLTLEEASHLMSQLDGAYPELFPKREVIKFEALGNARSLKHELPDSLTTVVEMPIEEQ